VEKSEFTHWGSSLPEGSWPIIMLVKCTSVDGSKALGVYSDIVISKCVDISPTQTLLDRAERK
jgi:hypothetical protein